MGRAVTITEYIASNGITSNARRVERNPNMDEWPGASHWRVTLRRDDQRLAVPFSMGSALNGEPEIADVLDSLASDASGYENAPRFEDWASDYGYNSDSRKAERTFRAVYRQTMALRVFLGAEYSRLLWEVERL
jgi:hypothetical protein